MQSRTIRVPWEGSEDLWRYREAAAVLVCFDYGKLLPRGTPTTSSTAGAELLADCDASPLVGGAMVWSLRTPVRQAALRRLVAASAIDEALSANSDRPSTVAQSVFEQLLTQPTLASGDFSTNERARALLGVADWVRGVPSIEEKLPDLTKLRSRLQRDQLLQPFRDLVGAAFAGRTAELAQLDDYVGVFDAHALMEKVRRRVEQVFSLEKRPPLFIFGPGGCGKSTLISQFVLRHAEIEELSRFPFAYLDFDRPGLMAEEPITLLREMVRQLAIQYPAASATGQQLGDQWAMQIARFLSTKQPDLSSDATSPARELGWFRPDERGAFLDEFSSFVNGLGASEQPLLLVLDTFEEVQFRSAAVVEEVFEFLDELQRRVPRLRTVLSGRAEIRSTRYSMRIMTIGDFDAAAARSFLSKRGITDSAIADTIFGQVGGSPLVLRLAADVAQIENATAGGIGGLDNKWLSVFQSRSIEVVLYKRILSHVYDKRVEQLAYPGLVLRVITSQVIEKVLGPACGTEISAGDADSIVETMRLRLSTILVSDSGGRLIHRPDIRSILLGDVAARASKDPAVADTLKRIHQCAIGYYAQFADPAQRAEEIYHRLALGLDRPALADRWEGGLKPYLGSSIRELPEEGQVFLAARLGLELPAEMWTDAEDDDWMLYAARVSGDFIAAHKAEHAFAILRERKYLWSNDDCAALLARVRDAVYRDLGREYENIRKTQRAGDPRTRQMTAVTNRATASAKVIPAEEAYATTLFGEGLDGLRVVALAVAAAHPSPSGMKLAIEGIREARSPFEQYHALRLARLTLGNAGDAERERLRDALRHPTGTPIHDSDRDRRDIKEDLLKRLEPKDKRRLMM
jgi:hypothetical protein